MSGAAKEIRTKIRSIKSTQKITRAMEMVAASKMKRAQDRMFLSRPYATQIQRLIGNLAHCHPEYRHPFMQIRAVKRVGFIVITSDRGLCGGLNVNLLRRTVAAMTDWHRTGAEVALGLIGTKAEVFFKRFGGKVLAQRDHLGDMPNLQDIIGVVKVMLDAYMNSEIDMLCVVYNEFVNSMIQRPQVKQLLPLPPVEGEEDLAHHWDYIYEPEAKELLEMLLNRYVESEVYQALVENKSSEQAARMVAMKSASDNANELIDDLQLAYNKARQASITRELAEIVAGAAAVAT
jgi:F-type H+-transporting ATPase subunit gamma